MRGENRGGIVSTSLTRRGFMERAGLALTLGAAARGASQEEPKRRPNVVFVLADDLGWAELGCYGNTFNETPHLDALAKQGMRFTQAYAAAPVCSPYRGSFMTGQYPARVGITDYLRPNDPKHLPTEHTTVAEALKRSGYATGMVGKWHLTGYKNHGAEEVPPQAHGFQEVMVSENRGIAGGSYFFPYHFNEEIEQRLPDKEYLVDRCNLEAVEFIERHKEEPFFLFLSHYAVHTGLVGKEDVVAKYAAKPGAGEGRNAPKNNPHLAAQLEAIDDGVGKIVAKLDELGLAENTILVFTSDNGGESRVTSNAPLRAGKSTLYEGGIREPLLVRWPGKVPAGKTCPEPVCSIDFYPTFLDCLGIAPPAEQHLDGLSLLPLLQRPAASLAHRAFFWHYPLAKPHFLGGRSSGAVRFGPWKLVEFFDTRQVALYHLENDPGEEKDLAREEPARVGQLLAMLKEWRKETGAVIPPECADYDPERRRRR